MARPKKSMEKFNKTVFFALKSQNLEKYINICVVFSIRKTTKTDEITFSTEYISSNKKERKLASISSDQSLDLTESRYLR